MSDDNRDDDDAASFNSSLCCVEVKIFEYDLAATIPPTSGTIARVARSAAANDIIVILMI